MSIFEDLTLDGYSVVHSLLDVDEVALLRQQAAAAIGDHGVQMGSGWGYLERRGPRARDPLAGFAPQGASSRSPGAGNRRCGVHA